jgi:hypothetical protein
MEVEQALLQQANSIIGLDPEDPDSAVKKQFYIDKYLEHHAKVLKLCYKQHKRYGEKRTLFRVTGYAEPQEMVNEQMEADPDLMITYDVLNNDPETTEKQLGQFSQLAMMDKYGIINQEAMITVAANAINPVLADAFIQGKEESEQKVLADVTDRLTKAYSGIDIGAGQGGAEIALQAINQYAQQPDIAERLQTDEAFAGRIETIAKQYNHQIQQAQNAETGKLGAEAGTFQGV